MNTPYLDYLIKQIEEVVTNYDCDGIFLDIVGVRVCFCQHCVKTLLDEGKDPYDEANAAELGERVYAEYCRLPALRRVQPDTRQTVPRHDRQIPHHLG